MASIETIYLSVKNEINRGIERDKQSESCPPFADSPLGDIRWWGGEMADKGFLLMGALLRNVRRSHRMLYGSSFCSPHSRTLFSG